MIRKPVRQGMALVLLLCLSWLTACTGMSVSKSPVVDSAFGESVRQARARHRLAKGALCWPLYIAARRGGRRRNRSQRTGPVIGG